MEMDWDRLRAFSAVAREGGFSAAARAIGRTQSAVSQAVLGLEQQLGHTLFVRPGAGVRGVRLTEAGRILLQHSDHAFGELSAATERLAALAELSAGRLVLGTSDTLGSHVLPPVLAAFRAAHPGIEVTLAAGPSPATAAAVAARTVDAGVVSLPLPEDLAHAGKPIAESLRIEVLRPQPDVLITSATHRWASRRRLHIRQLADEPLLLLGRDTAGRRFTDTQFARHRLRPRVAMEMNSVELLKRLVELDFGLSIVPEVAVNREVQAGTLHAVPLRGMGAARQVALILPAADPIPRAAAAFRALARTELSSSA